MSVLPIVRITSDGWWRGTSDGSARITGYLVVPEFDTQAVADVFFPGIVVQKTLTDAIGEWLVDHGGAISQADVPTILARANQLLALEVVAEYVPSTQPPYPLALPPYPSGLARFPDSNPTPGGWSISSDDKVVRGGGP